MEELGEKFVADIMYRFIIIVYVRDPITLL